MGLDMYYQAYPDDCEPLRRAVQDRGMADQLGHLNFICDVIALPPPEKYAIETDFDVSLIELVKQQPGLCDRYLDWGREWDILHFLLSENRRTGEWLDENEQWYIALFGKRVIHPDCAGWVRYSNSEDVRSLLPLFQSVTRDTLNLHFDGLLKKGAYKFHPGERSAEDIEQQLDGLYATFIELRTYYQQVAAHHEGIVAMKG
jgi:hypothetical protein